MTKKNLCGFHFRQRSSKESPSFFVFVSTARDIETWATINRLKDRQGGTQRRLSEARVRAIQKYFRDSPINTTPSGIILAFRPGKTVFTPFAEQNDITGCDNSYFEFGTLSFEYDSEANLVDKPAFVVDGQHRLIGMSRYLEEDLPILVSAILDANDTEQAFQFIVINNKVSRVPTDLLRSLLVDFNEKDLEERLKTARISILSQVMLVATVDDDPESPFFHLIKWDLRGDDEVLAIKPQAVESSLSYIRHEFPRLDDDEDSLIDFFFSIWNGVRDVYGTLWGQTNNRLFENAGFRAFSEYLTGEIAALSRSRLTYVDIYNPENVKELAKSIAEQIPIEFWESIWMGKSLDTSSGRDLIRDQIDKIRQNTIDGIPWWKGLTLVSF